MGKKTKRKLEQADEEETSDQKSERPRKRGRPRKIVLENTETDSESKRVRTHEEETEKKEKGTESPVSGGIEIDTGVTVEEGEDKKEESLKRKGRRKGHPRKSS